MGVVGGAIPVKLMNEGMMDGRVKGAYRCGLCQRVYCFACSDGGRACCCGAQQWTDALYVVTEIEPPVLADATGHGVSIWPGRSYLDRHSLPVDIDARELNRYMVQRSRSLNHPLYRSVLQRLVVRSGAAALVSILALAIFFLIFGFHLIWLTTIGLLVALITFRFIPILYHVSLMRHGIFAVCPTCRKSLHVDSTQPRSSWECISCGFKHFAYWRSRNLPAKEDHVGYDKTLKIRRQAEALMSQALLLYAQRRYAAAVPVLEKVIQLWPQSAEAQDELGSCLSRLGQHERAIQQSDIALQMDPSCRKFHTNKGYRLVRAGRFDEAEACVIATQRLEPDGHAAGKLRTAIDMARSGISLS